MDNQSTSKALERITSLLDESSFVELGQLVEARSTELTKDDVKQASDGVVTGYGTVDGALVYVYAQEPSVLGGSMGEMHARKIANLYDMAMKMGAPVVALVDCSGLRLTEGVDALYGMGRIYQKQTLASGVVPQLTAIFGRSGGGMAVISQLSDFVFMEKEEARLFVSAPDAVLGNKEDLIAKAQAQLENGNIDFAGSEEEIFSEMRRLLSVLPGNNEDYGEVAECSDDLNRAVSLTGDALSDLRQLSDQGIFIQTKRGFAPGVLTGFILMNGQTVGVVCSSAEDEKLRWKDAEQAAEFVNFCDAFEIPLLSLVDILGYHNCECGEKKMARAAGRLSRAYAEASTPLVSVVRNAVGSAGIAFASKGLGIDMVYAYPDAKFGVMDERKAAEILCEDVSQQAECSKVLKEQSSALMMAKRGYVDAIISPEETRQKIIAALEMLYTKSVYRPDKKHSTR